MRCRRRRLEAPAQHTHTHTQHTGGGHVVASSPGSPLEHGQTATAPQPRVHARKLALRRRFVVARNVPLPGRSLLDMGPRRATPLAPPLCRLVRRTRPPPLLPPPPPPPPLPALWCVVLCCSSVSLSAGRTSRPVRPSHIAPISSTRSCSRLSPLLLLLFPLHLSFSLRIAQRIFFSRISHRPRGREREREQRNRRRQDRRRRNQDPFSLFATE
ncbi:uncharacterized protein IWZ02DRAFT_104122 [Phyllosticta citriasiana]|uniref:uncharacterized protein n=1 Tax=Phyllosticta citriasiana TaxID=595635 RepID=UPI0030FDD7A5